MKNCLKTQLKSVVENDNLKVLGELVMDCSISPTAAEWLRTISVGCASSASAPIIITIEDGTIVGEGTSLTLQPGVSRQIVILPSSNNGCKIKFSNKYGLSVIGGNVVTDCICDASDLYYANDLTEIVALGLRGNLTELNLGNKSVTALRLSGTTKFVGDVSLIPNTGIITNFVLEKTGLTGDITQVLNGLTSLSDGLVALDGTTGVYGELSGITHDKILLILNTNLRWSWSGTRNSSRKIIAFAGGNFGNDLDAMLINQADCQIGYTGYESDTRYKTINVSGTRTSASDAAVASLKTKGYTVIINGKTL